MIKKFYNWLCCKRKFKNKVKFPFTSKITINSEFEGMSQIFRNVSFHGKLGFGSYIGNNCSLSADIGRFTSIAPHVRCNTGLHPYKSPFVSTNPCFYSLNPNSAQNGSTFADKQMYEENAYYDKESKIGVKIGSDCWIGEGAFLVGGIQIGNGAVVLAHAVVTKDIPPYAIAGGVPAKIIDYRYDKETIDFLLKTQWWNNSIEWFKENWTLLSDMKKFMEYYEKKN